MKKQSYALKCVVFFLLLIPTAFSQIQQRNLQVNMPGLGTNAVAVLTFSNGATGTFNSSTGELIIFAGSGFGTGSVNPWTNSFSAGGFGLTNLSLLDTATLTVKPMYFSYLTRRVRQAHSRTGSTHSTPRSQTGRLPPLTPTARRHLWRQPSGTWRTAIPQPTPLNLIPMGRQGH